MRPTGGISRWKGRSDGRPVGQQGVSGTLFQKHDGGHRNVLVEADAARTAHRPAVGGDLAIGAERQQRAVAVDHVTVAYVAAPQIGVGRLAYFAGAAKQHGLPTVGQESAVQNVGSFAGQVTLERQARPKDGVPFELAHQVFEEKHLDVGCRKLAVQRVAAFLAVDRQVARLEPAGAGIYFDVGLPVNRAPRGLVERRQAVDQPEVIMPLYLGRIVAKQPAVIGQKRGVEPRQLDAPTGYPQFECGGRESDQDRIRLTI